jgi:hypothetical protein
MSDFKMNRAWQTSEPPKDGTVIVVFGRVIWSDGVCTEVEPLFGQMRWSENLGESKGWHYLNGISVARTLEDEVLIDYWLEAPR